MNLNLEEQIKLLDAARALVDKLDLINQDPEFKGVWTFMAAHNMHYKGPNYGIELAQLKDALP